MQSPILALDAVTSLDTGRSFSPIWGKQLQAYVENNPEYGVRVSDDFTEYTATGNGTGSAVTSRSWSVDRDGDDADGTVSFTTTAGANGLATLASDTTSADDGVTAQYLVPCIVLPSHSTTPMGDVVFQTRVDLDDADAVFAGFSEAGDQFLDTDSLLPHDTSDYIGFYTDDNGATMKFESSTDNNGGTAVKSSYTIPAAYLNTGDYNKLAFRVNADKTVDLDVNGNVITSATNGITAASLPIETLTIRYSAVIESGSDAPSIIIDRVDAFVSR